MSDHLSLGDLGYPTADTVRRAQAYHDILTDLIAELREAHQRTGSESVKGPRCDPCALPWPCHTIQSADCAEARLNELNGESK